MATRKTTTSRTTKAAAVKEETIVSSRPAFRPKILILPIAIAVLAFLLWQFRQEFIVATVNGKPITRLELIKTLESKSGQQATESLIQKQLIEQEAVRRKISVSDNEVKSDISKIEKNFETSGQNLDLMLTQRGMTRADLFTQIKLQKLVNKMIGEITVSEKEVDDYVEKNKESIPEEANMDEIRGQVKTQLLEEKTNAKGQEFISNLEKKANIIRLKTF